MGGRSKFSFPLPGRKHSKEAKGKRAPESVHVASPGGLSKAQRILGADSDLNIDSPTWDDHSTRSDERTWRFPRPQSGTMSISISESTQSTYSGSGHHSEQWEQESGVLPRARMHDKASSSFMGQHYNDDMGTDSSSLGRRLRHADSSSTIRSFYDRQKSPLAISQQTSESSARDLALRKGFPPVAQPSRSPLLSVENVDPFHERFAEAAADSFQDKSRKKPAKLDLSMLFAKAKKGVHDVTSPSSAMTGEHLNQSLSARRRLSKVQSKESLQSQKHSIRSNQTGKSKVEEPKSSRRPESVNHKPNPRDTQGTLYQLYDHYEQLPMKSPYMAQIPETRIADRTDHQPQRRQHPEPIPTPPKSRESRSNQESQPTPGKEAFSWKNVRASMVSPHWEGSSAASISSHNSRTSRQTSHSGISHSDLRQNSVLSLSSDSEDEQEVQPQSHIKIPTKSPPRNTNSQRTTDNHRLSVQQPIPRTSESPKSQSLKPPSSRSSKSHGSRKGTQASAFLAIPEPKKPIPSRPRVQEPDSRSVKSQERTTSKRTSSIASATQLQPTPPLSPSSIEFRQSNTRSSRFMAVTKQEEALLEALRQKRANMREKIIQEHERVSTSPESKHDKIRQRYSEASSINTLRGGEDSNKEEILLYLDTPISDPRAIEAAEPSPDLSDFLSFGSDADNEITPRNSRIQTKNLAVNHSHGRPRADSSTSPNRRDSLAPFTSPITPRLSAVGSASGFRDHRRQNSKNKKRTAQQNAVRFVDDSRFAEEQLQVREHHEPEVIWGISGHI